MKVIELCERTIPVLLALWLYTVYVYWYATDETWLTWVWNRVTLKVSTLALLITTDIYGRDPAGKHSLRIVLLRYLINVFVYFISYIGYLRMEQASKDLKKQQETMLLQILQKRKDTAYGRKHGFADISSVAEFRAKHPVTTYPHYVDYIERVRKGEKNVMADEKIIWYATTSGTTGKNKVYPYFESVEKLYLVVFTGMGAYMTRTVPDLYNLRSRGNVRIPKELKKENDIGYGPVSVLSQDKAVMDIFITPGRVINHIYDEEKVVYIDAVFALWDRDMERIDLPFCSIARSFFHCLEHKWQRICDDIEEGKLSVEIDDETREILEKTLEKDPERAEELRKEFNKGMKDIAPRIWPHLKSIGMLASGPLKSQGMAMQKRYFGDTKVFSIVHIGTEGLYAYNLNPGSLEHSVYTVIPLANFMELIPVENAGEEDPKTVLLGEAEVGKEYEVVVSNVYGLYRYRSGDVVKIVSFYNQIPQYEFMYRLGQMLNVYGERTTEAAVQRSVDKFVHSLANTELVDYTTVENSGVDDISDLVEKDKVRFYLVFIELDNDYTLTEEDKSKYDGLLCEENEWYANHRQSGNIQHATVHQVQRQTFMKLKQKVLDTNYGVASSQFKMPRVQRNVDYLKLLSDNRI